VTSVSAPVPKVRQHLAVLGDGRVCLCQIWPRARDVRHSVALLGTPWHTHAKRHELQQQQVSSGSSPSRRSRPTKEYGAAYAGKKLCGNTTCVSKADVRHCTACDVACPIQGATCYPSPVSNSGTCGCKPGRSQPNSLFFPLQACH
jgi:hypothetical protein